MSLGGTLVNLLQNYRNIFHGNKNDEEVGLAIHISDKIHFKTKYITKENEGHYIMIKR